MELDPARVDVVLFARVSRGARRTAAAEEDAEENLTKIQGDIW